MYAVVKTNPVQVIAITDSAEAAQLLHEQTPDSIVLDGTNGEWKHEGEVVKNADLLRLL